ncbi:glycosyltransferase family 2 protein [uncultured Bacteroides sp.]|uniref:glycosyltransferase family 2 protein n=1 Tax=uncultured Bacteroides sp. TaxID=162156 RepID=UPI002676BE74|nr:glycosyltransferase family 2 protein [uncultured Bacteroides sp.]
MGAKLTVIIPFLNEKEEVRNTVKSLRESSDQCFKIILINDCSTDGYDYKKIAEDFETQYIEPSKRMGVAASRDEGVSKCNTDYFLFLDAHMRVFQRDWVEIID